MENNRMTTLSTSAASRSDWYALSACGLWLRVGFVGASLVGAGLALALRAEASPLSVLALAASGAAVAIFSWRHARRIVEPACAADAEASNALRAGGEPAARSSRALRPAAILGTE